MYQAIIVYFDKLNWSVIFIQNAFDFFSHPQPVGTVIYYIKQQSNMVQFEFQIEFRLFTEKRHKKKIKIVE